MLDDVYAVLGSGPSMSQATADYLHGRCHAVAVCDTYRLAPWADALVAWDRAWWRVHPEALAFEGRKYCGGKLPGHNSHALPITEEFPPGSNSGYVAMGVARELGAKTIVLLGFDMHGTHFFGAHPAPLRNTTAVGFRRHVQQFALWRGGCEVVNCTAGSSLRQFPFSNLKEVVP